MAWSDLDPDLQRSGQALLDVANAAGLNPVVTSTRRSYGKQLELWGRYLSGRSRLPAAPPGRSAHEYGWAFDVVVAYAPALADLGALWESWGGTWGGTPDPVHFELPGASAWLRAATTAQIAELRYPGLGGSAVARGEENLEAAAGAVSWFGIP